MELDYEIVTAAAKQIAETFKDAIDTPEGKRLANNFPDDSSQQAFRQLLDIMKREPAVVASMFTIMLTELRLPVTVNDIREGTKQ